MNIYQAIKLSLVTAGCFLSSAPAHAIISETLQTSNMEASTKPSKVKTYIVAQGSGAGSAAETFWQTIKDTSLPELFEMYIKQYPNSSRSIEAAKKLQALKTGAASTASEEAEKLINPGGAPQQSASVARSTVAGETNTMARNSGELSLLIQHNLNRVGCQAGSTDGDFGPRTRAAASRFVKYSGKALDTNAPSQALLSAVQSAPGIICPPIKTRTVRYRPERIQKRTSTKKKATARRSSRRKTTRTPSKRKSKTVNTAKKEKWGVSFFGGSQSSENGGGDGGSGDGGSGGGGESGGGGGEGGGH